MSNKDQVRKTAEKLIGDCRTDYGTDIYIDTLHRNLIVVSKTRARREFGINIDHPDYDY